MWIWQSEILNKDERKLISEWIGKQITEESISNPIYYAYKGKLSKFFHQKCNKTNNTLTIIETKEGKKYGGFI